MSVLSLGLQPFTVFSLMCGLGLAGVAIVIVDVFCDSDER
jgi:hypothetical protein